MERGNGSGGGPITGSLLYRLLKPNAASLGYGLFLAINAASVWGGVFPSCPWSSRPAASSSGSSCASPSCSP